MNSTIFMDDLFGGFTLQVSEAASGNIPPFSSLLISPPSPSMFSLGLMYQL